MDIVDFSILAGEFGDQAETIFAKSVDWSDPDDPDLSQLAKVCTDGSCWPDSLGIQIYAHQIGTLWVDEVLIFGDNASAALLSPEPASLALLGATSLLFARRPRK